jgi:hypothetical protein
MKPTTFVSVFLPLLLPNRELLAPTIFRLKMTIMGSRFSFGMVCFYAISVFTCGACSGNQLTAPPSWHKVQAGAFSLFAPAGWEFHRQQGIDSYVGEFAGDGFALEFDYGQTSSPLDEAVEPKYVTTSLFASS